MCTGQVTLDKQPTLRTVVNKTDQIDTTFRFFKMEVLAGEQDFMASVKENGCTFTFDFSRVYWNSRLSEEHWRVVELVKEGEVVVDVFAGVGPFAVLAAKLKGCVVYANDLNPHAFKHLQENGRSNHVSGRLHAYNLDGREFLASITGQLVERAVAGGSSPMEVYSHVIMNLPASSVEFLDVFRGLFRGIPEGIRPSIKLPLIHCYCFVKTASESEQERSALQQVTSSLGVRQLISGSWLVEVVRSVAPNKDMVRVSFTLPGQVAYSGEVSRGGEGGGEVSRGGGCGEVSRGGRHEEEVSRGGGCGEMSGAEGHEGEGCTQGIAIIF